jgi:serine/threonine protein kinase
MMFIFLGLVLTVHGTRPPLLDPLRFPQPETDFLPIGQNMYRLTKYLDLGSSTRVFLASRAREEVGIPDSQLYKPPSYPGKMLPVDVPEEIVIKCISSSRSRLLDSMENEFSVYAELNKHPNIRKPIGLYLSPRWQCNNGEDFCQYVAMTYVNSDIGRLVSRGQLQLKAPIFPGLKPSNERGIYSFEVFLLSFGLNLIETLVALHEAGFAHGDVRSCNIALELPKNDYVTLLDVGASKELKNYAEEEQLTLKSRDFAQVGLLIHKLLTSRIHSEYRRYNMGPLGRKLLPLVGKGKDVLVQFIKHELQNQYGVQSWESKIVYKYIP